MSTTSSTKTVTKSYTSELYMNDKRSSKKSSTSKSKGGATKGFAGALRNLQNNAFQYAGSVRPGMQSPQKVVLEETIMKPDYAFDGKVSNST